MFTVGGTDINVHKFLGPKNTSEANATADQPHYDAVKETNIQDMLFLENRDRKYDPDIYNMRAIYNVQDIDFDLSQFGLFLTNDTLFMTVHINSSVKTMGRKLMPGDVIELPHLKDEYARNDYATAFFRDASDLDVQIDYKEMIISVINDEVGERGSSIGVAKRVCNEDIIIELKESYWKQESVMRRFDLMYHELGHDALNLKHVCNRYDIMYTSNSEFNESCREYKICL